MEIQSNKGRPRFHAFGMVILSMLCFSQMASAQWQIGFGAIGSAKVDRFKQSVYKPGIGMFTNLTTSSILGKTNPMKLQFGLYLDFQRHGSERFDITLSDPIGEEGKVVFRNSTTAQHFLLRYGYEFDRIMVFTDFILGHRKFYSEMTTGLKHYDEEYEDDVNRIHSFNTFRHGIGFGMRYSFGRSFGLEMRADYTRGNKVRYFDLDKIEKLDDEITYVNETWAYSDLFVGTISVNWKLFRPRATNTTSTNKNDINTRDDYYDNYDRSRTNSSTNPTRYRTPRTRTTTPPVKKKKVTPKTNVKEKEEKEKEKEINW